VLGGTPHEALVRAALAGALPIDVEEFADWLLLVGWAIADDSAGKNVYLYHGGEPDGALGLLFRYVPWDFNDSFGQSWQTNRVAPTMGNAWTMNRDGVGAAQSNLGNRVFSALQARSV
jgi:hypothetical protein